MSPQTPKLSSNPTPPPQKDVRYLRLSNASCARVRTTLELCPVHTTLELCPCAHDPRTVPCAHDPRTVPCAHDPRTVPVCARPCKCKCPCAHDPKTVPCAHDPRTVPCAHDPKTVPCAHDPRTVPCAHDPVNASARVRTATQVRAWGRGVPCRVNCGFPAPAGARGLISCRGWNTSHWNGLQTLQRWGQLVPHTCLYGKMGVCTENDAMDPFALLNKIYELVSHTSSYSKWQTISI
jgi:hypothetical protein